MSQIERVKTKYDFTEDEKDQMARRAAKLQSDLEGLDDELALFKAKMKMQMDPIRDEIHSLCQRVTDGFEFREHFCRAEFDYEGGTVTFRDVKTEAIIETRILNPDEKQRNFFQ